MIRSAALACACLLALTAPALGQTRPAPPPPGAKPAQTPRQGGRQLDPETRQELQQLRADLKRDQDEAKRLQNQIQLDKKAGDKMALKTDTDKLKQVRADIKKDNDRIKQLQSGGA